MSTLQFMSTGFLTADASSGTSAEARALSIKLSEFTNQTLRSISLGKPRADLYYQLYALFEEGSSANWDACGAVPINTDSYWSATRFLEKLPLNFGLPDGGIYPTGEVSLEWFKSNDRWMALSFAPGAEIRYAYIHGGRKASGVVEFAEDIPSVLLQKIAEITG